MIETLQYSQPHIRSEISRMPEFKPEQEEEIMKSPWSAFDQIGALRRHRRADGKIITKGFAVSIALMPGVSGDMREKAVSQTLGIESPYIQRWEGEEKGEIFCMSQDHEGTLDVQTLVTKFIETTGDIIDNEHPFRNHKRVERFLELQQQRLEFTKIVAEDAQRILDTPEFTGWSSRDQRYKGEGKFYLIELYEEDGIVYGSCPDGSMRPVSELPIDEAHKAWINDGLIPIVKNPMLFPEGYRVFGDSEDTETVSKCGGADDAEQSRGSCSDFFEDMESEVLQGVLFKGGSANTSHASFKMVDALGRVHFLKPQNEEDKDGVCGKCGQQKNGSSEGKCNCSN